MSKIIYQSTYKAPCGRVCEVKHIMGRFGSRFWTVNLKGQPLPCGTGRDNLSAYNDFLKLERFSIYPQLLMWGQMQWKLYDNGLV